MVKFLFSGISGVPFKPSCRKGTFDSICASSSVVQFEMNVLPEATVCGWMSSRRLLSLSRLKQVVTLNTASDGHSENNGLSGDGRAKCLSALEQDQLKVKSYCIVHDYLLPACAYKLQPP